MEQINEQLYIMVKQSSAEAVATPLYIHSFVLDEIPVMECKTIGDKLLYHRLRCRLKQSEVAEYLGVSVATYQRMEKNKKSFYQQELLVKDSELFGVEMPEFSIRNVCFKNK